TFDGSADGKSRGSGDVVWEAGANYLTEMSKLTGETITARRALELAMANLELSYARGMADAGYKFSTADLLSLRFGGITPEYAAALADAGYKFSPDELRRLRFAGVGDEFAVALKKAGYNFSAEDLAKLRFSGVSADYACDLAVPGKQNLSADEIVSLRRRGID